MFKLVGRCLPLLGWQGEVKSSDPGPPSNVYQRCPPSPSSPTLKTDPSEFVSAPPTPPTPPYPADHADMERPSSSDGLHSQTAAWDNLRLDSKRLDKRVSRDDSWIVTSKSRARTRHYAAPGLPTPDASPTSKHAEPRFVPKPWVATSGDGQQIGMALGSPSLTPPQWSDPFPKKPSNMGSPAIIPQSTTTITSPDAPAPRKGSAKWKIFGMFGRKPVDNSSQPPLASQPQYDFMPSRTQTDIQYTVVDGLRAKPPITRSQTMPTNREQEREAKRRPSMSRMRKGKTNEIIPPMPSPYGNSASSVNTEAQNVLLDVNIPNIELERYSVMFEKLLNPQRASIYSRRQAGTLEQLKPVHESKDVLSQNKKTARRLTSPVTSSHARSPSFLLFPQPPTSKRPSPSPLSNNQTLSPISARYRSNTSPAHLPSPTRGTFDQVVTEPEAMPVGSAPSVSYNHLRDSPQNGKLTIASLARVRADQKQPSRASPLSAGTEPATIVESPTEIASPASMADRDASQQLLEATTYVPPTQTSAAQQATESPASSSTTSLVPESFTSTVKHSASPSSSSAQTYRTMNSAITLYTDTDVDEIDPMKIGGGREMTPAEVSIARQVSLSRQQRKIFQPHINGPVSHRQQAPPAFIRIDKVESARMVTPRTATPTLVTPEDPMHSPYVTQLGVARSRKSERIIIDDDEDFA